MIKVTEKNSYWIVELSGTIGWESSATLDATLTELIEDGHLHIIFKLDKVEFICSGAIGLIIYTFRKLEKLGGSTHIVSSNQYVNYIFETLGIDKIFQGNYVDFASKIFRENHKHRSRFASSKPR